jgi:8-oxo-dGTP pyrophosphatase MutT (NUDIX family)
MGFTIPCKSKSYFVTVFSKRKCKPKLPMAFQCLDYLYSFPGGKRDNEDKNIVDTAVRETVEELGIQSDKIEIWGPLTPTPDRVGRMFIYYLSYLKRNFPSNDIKK